MTKSGSAGRLIDRTDEAGDDADDIRSTWLLKGVVLLGILSSLQRPKGDLTLSRAEFAASAGYHP